MAQRAHRSGRETSSCEWVHVGAFPGAARAREFAQESLAEQVVCDYVHASAWEISLYDTVQVGALWEAFGSCSGERFRERFSELFGMLF